MLEVLWLFIWLGYVMNDIFVLICLLFVGGL